MRAQCVHRTSLMFYKAAISARNRNTRTHIRLAGHSEQAPTGAPRKILFSIPLPSQVDIFLFALSQPWSQFFFATLFSPRPLPHFVFPLISIFFWNSISPPALTQFLCFFLFFFFLLLKFFPPTYYPPLSPTNLLTYLFKFKIDSSPSTYSPINLKCATLIPTHLPTPHLFIYLLALPLSYLPTL